MDTVTIVREAVRALDVPVIFESGWASSRIAGRGSFTPRFVMLHHTAGVNSLGTLLNEHGSYSPIRLAHFLVDRDGTVHVLSGVKSYHAGAGSGYGVPRNQMNDFAWGIEIEDLGRGKTMTIAQRISAAKLAKSLLRAMDQPVKHLIEHEHWSSTGKIDTQYSTPYWRQLATSVTLKGDVVGPLPTIELVEVQPGETGKPVAHLQRALKRAGYQVSFWDASRRRFGDSTRKQYQRWQRSLGYSGLDADGAPGPASLQALGRRTNTFQVA